MQLRMTEVVRTVLELLSMLDGRCLQAGLVTQQDIISILIPLRRQLDLQMIQL